MEEYIWILWLVLGVSLIIAEIFTLGFVLFWFGVGAVAAAAAGYFGLGIFWQFAVFAIISTALTVMSRTIFARAFSHHDDNQLKIGADALPGKIGTVTEASRGALNEGAVRVYGSVWTAFPADGETVLEAGEKGEGVSVEGSSIYVRRVSNELPEWRSS